MSKFKRSIDLNVVIEWCCRGEIKKVLGSLANFSIEELNTPGKGDMTILQESAANGRELIAKALINLGVDVNVTEVDSKLTALHYAAWTGGSIKIIEMLLDAGSDVHILDSLERTPLHYAVGGGAPSEVIQLLIDSGINANVKDILGKTALDTAIENNHKDAIIFLQSYRKTSLPQEEAKVSIKDVDNLVCKPKISVLDACINGASSASTLVFAKASAAESFYSGGNDYTAAIAGGRVVVAGCIASVIDNANSIPCEDEPALMGSDENE